MHPTVRKELMNARVADLHRRAERGRTARAAGSARKPHGHAAPGYLAAILVRRALASLLAARGHRPAPSQAEQVPTAAPPTLTPETETP